MSALAVLIVVATLGLCVLLSIAFVWLLDRAPLIAMAMIYGPILGFMSCLLYLIILAKLSK